MRASREIAFWLHAERERRRENRHEHGRAPAARVPLESIAVEMPVGRDETRVVARHAPAPRREAQVETSAAPAAPAILALLANRPALLAPPEVPKLLATAGEAWVAELCADCGQGIAADWLACFACGALAPSARLPATLVPAMAPPRPTSICPHCGASFPRGKLACPECGSDSRTGWRSQEDIDYEAVELPEEETRSGSGPIPRWIWVGAAIVVVVALLLAALA